MNTGKEGLTEGGEKAIEHTPYQGGKQNTRSLSTYDTYYINVDVERNEGKEQSTLSTCENATAKSNTQC